MLQTVFNAFGIAVSTNKALPFGSGLINDTWIIDNDNNFFILQRINHQVFKNPAAIAYNINIIATYLLQQHPHYLFVMPVKSMYGEDIFFDKDNGYFRLSPFVQNSHTIDVVQQPQQAFEAANQFGQFTKLLANFEVNKLKITLPNFHNLSLRYQQFEEALVHGNKKRIQQANELINTIRTNKHLVKIFEKIKHSPQFKLRVTHHDTKISNVLFDENNKGMCVIDLDTLMPGYFVSDVGDMMRTYLSPVSEEEKDFQKITIRDDYFVAILQGYLGQLKNELSDEEKNHFVYAGKFMIYMQALRFLTDYLNDDIYYGSKYEGHNFVRSGNQLTLLQKLIDKEDKLQALVTSFATSAVFENI